MREWISTAPRKALDSHALPEPLRAILDEPPLVNEWIPEVLANAMYLAYCDAEFESDDSFLAYNYDYNKRLLSGPLYRILMMLATPELMVRMGASRWESIHRGSKLMASVENNQVSARLVTPSHLVPPLMAHLYAIGFRVALECSGATSVEVRAVDVTPELVSFKGTWDWRSKSSKR